MISRWTKVLPVLLMAIVSIIALRDSRATDQSEITLEGDVLVEPIDARRILVAVDTNSDGIASHLFLYTARGQFRVTPRWRNVHAKLHYRDGELLWIAPDSRAHRHALEFIVTGEMNDNLDPTDILFKDSLGLRHYVPTAPIHVAELYALTAAANCDASPDECIQIAGQWIPFPG